MPTDSRKALHVTACCISAIILVSIVSSYENPAFGQITGDARLLKVASTYYKENRAKIKTWSGVVEVESEVSRPDGPTRKYRSSVEFAFDAKRAATRWNWSYEDFVVVYDGRAQDQPPIGLHNGLVRDSALYLVDFKPNVPGTRTFVIHEPSETIFGPMSQDFDPFYFMSDHGEEMDKRLTGIHNHRDSPGAKNWTVERDGDLITVRSESTIEAYGGGILAAQYDIDLAKGGNPVLLTNISPINDERLAVVLDRINDVWIPREVDYSHTQLRSGKATKHSRSRLSWRVSRVNEVLHEDEFSLARIGARPGDRVSDSRSGVEYVVPIEEITPQPAQASSNWRFAVVVGGAAIAAMLAIWTWRRTR
jgi:hypothetical protein